jgi:hypothetical protein
VYVFTAYVNISVIVHIYFRIAICFPANRELLRASYRVRREMIAAMSLEYTHTYIHTKYTNTYMHSYIEAT